MREKADSNVQAALDTKIARESELKYDSMKHSVRAESCYQQAINDNPDYRGKKLVAAAKNVVNVEHEKAILDFLAGKSVQGKFSDIIKLQSQDPFYRSIMFDLPHGQLSFVMRACVDCLPSFANLRRWGKVVSDKCALCDSRETMYHVLTGCAVALNQKRFDLRHNSILLHIAKQMRENKSHSDKRILADVPGFQLPDGGTIPPEIFVTQKKPDIVMIDEKSGEIELFELTSCADKLENIANAQSRKYERYKELSSAINGLDNYSCKLSCFEVCALGNIPDHARKTIRHLVGPRAARRTFQSLAKIAIATSYYTFNRRREREYHAPPLFERRVLESAAKG